MGWGNLCWPAMVAAGGCQCMHWERRKSGEMGLHQSDGLAKSNACQLYVFCLSLSRCNNVTADTKK